VSSFIGVCRASTAGSWTLSREHAEEGWLAREDMVVHMQRDPNDPLSSSATPTFYKLAFG
jgi:hypothetical protein